MTTVGDALAHAVARGLDRLDAQLLLGRVLGCCRTWLYGHGDDELDEALHDQYLAWVARRETGEPFAYLVGEKEFHGLMLQVSPAVLVPRPDTETLVDWALECLARHAPASAASVVDLGTGSGAIALAVKHRAAGAHVVATDVSGDALAMAEGNARRLGLSVGFLQGSWWNAVRGQRFHLALCNPPYIAGADPHLDALTFEPRLALTPEGDGLQAYRDVLAEARDHLEPGAWLLFEHGHDQAEAVASLMRAHGFVAVVTRTDLAGLPRCTGGCCI